MRTASAIPGEYLETDRRLLWGLCYRMTGNAADADDLVQETFVRAIEKPPRRLDEPLRPWLIRVAINLSRDLLRRRRRRGYVGEWLPSPIPTDGLDDPPSYEPPASSGESPGARYEMIESISFAFLLALEALTPSRRAVLLLRDVFDYTTEETAEALGMTEANVKVSLHRARRRMQEYDKTRSAAGSSLRDRTRLALERFVICLSNRDAVGLERLLTEDVVSLSDGGGVVAAAMVPVRGRPRVLRLLTGLNEKSRGLFGLSLRSFNGLPALLFDSSARRPGFASRFVLVCEIDREGRVKKLYTVLSPAKLTAVEQGPAAQSVPELGEANR